MATKAEKAARMEKLSRSDPSPPIPKWPELPAFLKQKFPDYAEQIDLYNQQCEEFFRKSKQSAQ